MTDEPKPIARCTRVSGGARSLQYYAIRTRFSWRITEKSRCWTTVMREVWGGELDAITLLGIEPKPVERTWRRFEELRELVDLGRNRTIANALLTKLQKEAAEEKGHQFTAERSIATEVAAQMEILQTSGKDYAKNFATAISDSGICHAMRMGNPDDAVEAGLMAAWAEPLSADLQKKLATTHDSDTAAGSVIADHLAVVKSKLLTGTGPPGAYDEVGRAAKTLWPKCAVAWCKLLVHRTEDIEQIEGARQINRHRKRERDLDNLVRSAVGVHSAPGAP